MVFWGELSARLFFDRFWVRFWGAQDLKNYDFVKERHIFLTFQKDRFFDGSGVTFGPLLAPFWDHLPPLYLPRDASGAEKVHFWRVMKTHVFSSIFKGSR